MQWDHNQKGPNLMWEAMKKLADIWAEVWYIRKMSPGKEENKEVFKAQRLREESEGQGHSED